MPHVSWNYIGTKYRNGVPGVMRTLLGIPSFNKGHDRRKERREKRMDKEESVLRSFHYLGWIEYRSRCSTSCESEWKQIATRMDHDRFLVFHVSTHVSS